MYRKTTSPKTAPASRPVPYKSYSNSSSQVSSPGSPDIYFYCLFETGSPAGLELEIPLL